MLVVLIGFTIKFDFLGVTSIGRGVGLLPSYYTCLLHFFSSSSVDINKLLALWVEIIFKNFDGLVKVNGRNIIVADGIKVGKEGKKMPGVKWLYQSSESNTKPEYIMGHHIQAIAILAKGIRNYFAVPLTAKIHEGVRFNCKDKRTILDKLVELLLDANLPCAYYLVADKYYCSGRLMKMLVAKGIHLVTMMKKNSVAFHPFQGKHNGPGRTKKYGEKVKLFDLFTAGLEFTTASMPTNEKIIIEYCVIQLLWRPLGDLAQFVLVKHPTRGNSICMSTDLSIASLDLILCYSLRFKIEVLFKQAIHQIGTFMYRFWFKGMLPRKRGNASGDHVLQFSPKEFKEKIALKLHAYHLFIQLAFIAQGLMQFLSIYYHKQIWGSFGSWLRTIRDDTLPSEKVVTMALRKTYIEFLKGGYISGIFEKFMRSRTDIHQLQDSTVEFSEAA
ncbi:MAG: transposase [Candidatus Thiodiazotropha sp. (ex Lucinoma aequizonata)]|nr:transposase [Candidatus Thiodiazotropha sp. (ex Lucinoma aequizonata)]